MRVKITTDAFIETFYEVLIDKRHLTLYADGSGIVIPLNRLRQFSVYGRAEAPSQFMLITADTVYHGVFPTKEDMEQVLGTLKNASGQQIEINLNMNCGEERT